jgi:undecaprenyl-diphosphatase
MLSSLDRQLFRLVQRLPAFPLEGPLVLCAHQGPLAAVGCMLLAGWRGGVEGRRAVFRCLTAVGLLYGLVDAIGILARRARPFAAEPSVQPLVRHSAGRSFPSRHVASAAAMSVIVIPTDPDLGKVLGLLAVGMALGRVRAGLHYPSDVAAGAALGYLVGRAMR